MGFGELWERGRLRDMAQPRAAQHTSPPSTQIHPSFGARAHGDQGSLCLHPHGLIPWHHLEEKNTSWEDSSPFPCCGCGFYSSRWGRREGKTRCIHPTQPKLRSGGGGGGGCAAGGRQGLRFPRLFLPVLIFSAAA